MKTFRLNSLTLLLFLALIPLNNVFAQHNNQIPLDHKRLNEKLQEIVESVFDYGWFELKEEKQINPNTIFNDYSLAFGLSLDDYMKLVKIKTDELGYTHYRYQQFYKGIKVEGAEYIVHSFNGVVIRANGKIAEGLNIDINPFIDELTALNFALNEMDAEQYMWEDIIEEQKLKKLKNDKNATYYPLAELVIVFISPNFNLSPDSFRLTYKFNINIKKPFGSYSAYIDANSGELVKKVSNIDFHDCHTGVFVPSYAIYGTSRSFTTKPRGWPNNDYILKDECRGGGIHTNMNGNNVDDGNNHWSLPSERPATTTHWAMQMTYDYYHDVHTRNSYDGSGAELISDTKVLVAGSHFNASFNRATELFSFGQANGDDGYNSLDVVGHEFTHGVIKYEAGLGTAGEAGALGESFGDIFGEMVELQTLGTINYIHAQEIWGPTGNRSLIDPKANDHPNTYQGEFWNNLGGDIHVRNGVQNYWFFLLAVGGNGFVDDDSNNPSYNVNGIGPYLAAHIAYRNINNYLTSASTFSDAKNGSIFAAMDLFGECSNEVVQTINAWNAVGVTSQGGIHFDLQIDCNNLNYYHVTLNTSYIVRTANDMFSNCNIASNGNLVSFSAGHAVILTDGFRSGDNFRAHVYPCFENNMRIGNVNNAGDTTYVIELNENQDQAISDSTFSQDYAITILPNPTKGNFDLKINFNEEKKVRIAVYDISGNEISLISDKNMLHENYQIDISDQPNGIYIVGLVMSDKMIIKKIILSK